MTYPTPEEVKQIGNECGVYNFGYPSKYIQDFALRMFELGRKMESDLMAAEALRNNTGE